MLRRKPWLAAGLLLVAVPILVVGAWLLLSLLRSARNSALPEFAPLPDRLLALERSPDPRKQEFARQIRRGPEDLARERELAPAAGILTDWRQVQRPSPPPAEDASTDWRIYEELRQRFGLNREQENVIAGLARSGPASPQEIAAAREILRSRPELLGIAHRAAGKPRCVFRRDWSKGTQVLFSEFPAMREAARLLRAESYLLAVDGKLQQAVANQRLGLRIADQAASEPVSIAYLVGVAIDVISLTGLEAILYHTDGDPKIAALVRRAVLEERPGLDRQKPLQTEPALFAVEVDRMRAGGPAIAGEVLRDGPAEAAGNKPRKSRLRLPTLQQLSPEERQIWAQYLDAAEASYLRNTRQVLDISRMPPREQPAALRRFSARLKESPVNPVDVFAAMALPVLADAGLTGIRAREREAAVIAACLLFEHRARAGAFPAQAALPGWPADPFTGKPLGYRKESAGFVVYSVGREGAFTGGPPGQPIPRQESGFRYPAPPASTPNR